jgi:uncharacterized membrane protein YphA (DoxX/SURF4 family)
MRSEHERIERKKNRYDDVWWALRVGLGATAVVAGADKFTKLLTDWDKYLAPRAARILPMDGKTFMRLVGVIEIAVGLGILLPPRTKLHAYAMSAWLMGIAANLALHDEKYLDVAARDVNMALAAFALARLTGGRQGQMSLRESLESLAEKTADVGRGLRVASERNGSAEKLPRAA